MLYVEEDEPSHDGCEDEAVMFEDMIDEAKEQAAELSNFNEFLVNQDYMNMM